MGGTEVWLVPPTSEMQYSFSPTHQPTRYDVMDVISLQTILPSALQVSEGSLYEKEEEEGVYDQQIALTVCEQHILLIPLKLYTFLN